MKKLKTFEQFRINESLDFKSLKLYDSEYDGNNLFAVALHRLTKFPIYTVRGYFKDTDDYRSPDYVRRNSYEDVYNCVKLPNGNFLSSNGERTQKDITGSYFTDYGRIELVELSEMEAINLYKHEDDQDYTDPIDEEFIQNLLDRINEILGLELAKKINESIDGEKEVKNKFLTFVNNLPDWNRFDHHIQYKEENENGNFDLGTHK